MQQVLLISGHPQLEQSLANKIIIESVKVKLPNVQVRRLDHLYPDYQIDVIAEQAALMQADIIVWQFPFYWYSMPALMKLWLDQVFLHGFAHGANGNKLQGKKLILSFTTGASEALYQPQGLFQHTIQEYLLPFVTTAQLCGLILEKPIYTQGISYIVRQDDKQLAIQTHLAEQHAECLVERIKQLISK